MQAKASAELLDLGEHVAFAVVERGGQEDHVVCLKVFTSCRLVSANRHDRLKLVYAAILGASGRLIMLGCNSEVAGEGC